jgi:hypothetical protein
MTEPKDEPEDAIPATNEETASFDDHTEATDDETPAPSPIPGVKTP